MKNKFLLIALIAVILTAGMILVSCGAGCPGDGKCGWTKEISELPKYCGTKMGSGWSKAQIDTATQCGKDMGKALEAEDKKYSCGC